MGDSAFVREAAGIDGGGEVRGRRHSRRTRRYDWITFGHSEVCPSSDPQMPAAR